jgi:lipid-A-disaccharide synthase
VPSFSSNPAAGTPPAPPRAPDGTLTALFTAFEPSGDEHAAAVIAELRRRHPRVRVFAWGGPRMERAGATIVERTGDDAVMGLPGLAKIREHQRINQRVERWLDEHRPDVHVPVDSPAANYPLCELAKARGVRVVHLVAPQIWAWGRWRIRKLRRLTDLVLCLLPFEERFFTKRRVPARFIGHMLFDHPVDEAELARRAAGFRAGDPRIAIMPGSRPAELEHNFPLLLDVFALIRAQRPGAVGVVAATTERVAEDLRTRIRARFPEGAPIDVEVGQTDAVVYWSTLALVKSGTVTLQVARQERPMVILYKKSSHLLYLLARSILATKLFALPNVLAHREIVPEFVPHFGGPEPIASEALRFLDDPALVQRQREEVRAVLGLFRERHAGAAAADAIAEVLGLIPPAAPATGSGLGSGLGRDSGVFQRPGAAPTTPRPTSA